MKQIDNLPAPVFFYICSSYFKIMTIEDLFNDMVSVNTITYSNGWKNPRMFKTSDDFCEDYFFIKLDGFEEVTDTSNVEIYNVSLKHGQKTIHCKRRS